jgi:Holliday junction resolvase RusA-like endonuclease
LKLKSSGNLIFCIESAPVSKARHRTTKSGRTYNIQTQVEAALRWEIKTQLPDDFKIIAGPVKVTVSAHFKRPRSHWGTGRNEGKLKSSAPEWCMSAKDIDNIQKIVLDVMNDLVYKDDRQVVELRGYKHWVSKPDRFGRLSGFMIIEIEEL